MVWDVLMALAVAAFPVGANSQDRPVMQFDFYRAMRKSDIGAYPLQNFNLASVAGVGKYIHTEVIAEHVIGNVQRTTRKNGIDTIRDCGSRSGTQTRSCRISWPRR